MSPFQSKVYFLLVSFFLVTLTIVCAGSSASSIENLNGGRDRLPEISTSANADSRLGLDRAFSGRSFILKSFLLLPLGLTFLAIALLAFIPTPVVTIPTGRNYLSDFYSSTTRLAKDVLRSDQCIERISCEIARASKNYQAMGLINNALNSFPVKSNWTERISRAFNGGAPSCVQYLCNPVATLKKKFTLNES